MKTFPLLTILTLIPLVGGGAALLASSQTKLARRLAFGAGLLALAVAALLWAAFDPGGAGWQFEERLAWVPSLGIEYHLGS